MSLSVEEALESISVLPLEVRRHQELLHTLDVRWIGHMTDLRKAHENYIKGVRARAEKLPKDGSVNVRKEAADEKDLAAVMALSAECRQVSEEKVSVARQSQETVTAAITKLEAYLRDFEEELRQSGELNDEIFEETQSEAGDDTYEPQYAGRQLSQSHRAGAGGGGGGHSGRPTSHATGSQRAYAAAPSASQRAARDAAFAFSPSATTGRADDNLAYSSSVYNKAGGGGGGGVSGFQKQLQQQQQQQQLQLQQQHAGALSPSVDGGAGGSGSGAVFTENAEPDDPTPYCLCQKPQYGEMIGCESADCPHGEWFHFFCVALTAAPKGVWYCPPCRKTNAEAAERAPKKSHHRKGGSGI